jgi:hypothetical protein
MNFYHAAAGLLSYVFQSGLLLAVGILLPRALRFRHPRTLLVYWRLLLLVVLLLPILPVVGQPTAPLPTLAIDGLTVEAWSQRRFPQQPRPLIGGSGSRLSPW